MSVWLDRMRGNCGGELIYGLGFWEARLWHC